MLKSHEIICIECPMACPVQLDVDDTGTVIKVTGQQCKRGKLYSIQEYGAPMRTLTATIVTEGSDHALLPVRSNKPIPKDMLRECMSLLSEVRVRPVVRIGDTLIKDISGTGADIIYTGDLLD